MAKGYSKDLRERGGKGVERDTTKRTKPAATRAEAYALARSLKEIGEPHLGAAALICFEWHRRPEHIRSGDITWADYRPPEREHAVRIRHRKTGEKGWVPLADNEGLLYPELEAYLSQLPCLGLPIVLTAGRRGPARPYSNEYAQRKVREARLHAGLNGDIGYFLGLVCCSDTKKRRAPCNENVSYSCVKDEGGPLGIGFQERVPNHSKRLRSKAVVVSVGAKARGMTPSRCASGRRAKANPSMTRRKETDVVKTRGAIHFWDKSVGCLMTGQTATGVKGA
jgi:hypothetical protein